MATAGRDYDRGDDHGSDGEYGQHCVPRNIFSSFSSEEPSASVFATSLTHSCFMDGSI
jgi:hypothetical protein